MTLLSRSATMLISCSLLLLPWLASAAPKPLAPSLPGRQAPASPYWLSQIQRQGTVAYGANSAGYKVFRNVKDYGAVGNGVTDDTVAINNAIADGQRCALNCDSSTTVPAIVYFPPGIYAVSAPIIQYYYTQFVGDALSLPTLLALPSFEGIAVVDTDPYIPGASGAQWYTNQNNFYRQMRNFIVDITQMPEDKGAGIHWQVAQATSLQNIVCNMRPKSSTNKQQGIFMDNGSGGLMTDLVFNGGNYGAFLGNQQFTTRNMTFNGCNTAIFLNWAWIWTLKSLTIDQCDVGVDMSNLANSTNQTVGSVLILDSIMSNTGVGVLTSYNATSQPATGGTLIMHHVDLRTTRVGVVGANGVDQILPGSLIIDAWGQGDTYRSLAFNGSQPVKRAPQGPPSESSQPCSSVITTTVVITSTATANRTLMTTAVTITVSPVPTSANSNHTLVPTSRTTSLSNGTATSSATPIPSTCTLGALPFAAARIQQKLIAPSISSSLLGNSGVFSRSKPQYETVPASSFISVKSAGAKGDGITDDTVAIQNIFNSASPDQVVYFDHGAYVITQTVNVPSNIRVTGEIWPLVMASGQFFRDSTRPQPVFRVGQSGDIGSVEISDLIFETMGPLPGAVMMEWNVAESSQGSCGMWDVHFRIGGSAGTQLQQDICMANVAGSSEFKPECAGSFLMMHITQQATAYLENCWFWVADHELDLPMHNQTNIYNGRGLLVESRGPVWLWGTSSEHHQLYNYQFNNAQDVFMGAIQTETAYMQSAPNALDGGFSPVESIGDPMFDDCTNDACKKTWGIRIVNSQNIYMYGGGLYSFFDNYDQKCLETNSCQENMVDIRCSANINLYGLTTKASTNMVNVNGQPVALQSNHTNMFGQTLMSFEV
ncbi:glucan 1,3-beta-glucosidase [Exophiala aquamarina CBS 119918]|uniref:Glucan 1,3-beta-glucosidase n=1 Tax=Exophiala aquamarina CBS 119918 TaxID=1182545 RepID=A0A072P926_9EURO|nr:glucan 1,3-beta-glucosidase [Exophiala aquamarina CBS 119918]KEF56629.1 glucan 1,3-beta-glucosidase [Exophiala aquamarina CBS 119918]